MKKIWKTRKEEEGVSPVIATILMVAITVVLAAVLYVMVIGFTPPQNDASAGSWNEVKALNQTAGKATFGAFTGSIEPINLRIYVKANGIDAGYVSWGSNTDPSTVSWVDGPAGATVTYYDYDPNSGKINSGDYIVLNGLNSGTSYELEAYNVASSSILPMMGDSPTFTTP